MKTLLLVTATVQPVQLRVCVNRTCARQGSRDTLAVLSDLAPPTLSVLSCGCLGRCGAGPNLVVLPGELFFRHCGTPARAAEVLRDVLRDEGFDPRRSLEALGLRKMAEGELREKGDAAQAETLLSKAISLKPSGGLHVIYNSRAAARLAMGNTSGALEDVKEALAIAPEYPQAFLCQGDIFMVMEEYDAAEKVYSSALQLDPSIRRSKSFKARVAELQKRFAAADADS